MTALSLQTELLCLVSSACPSVFPLACRVVVSMGRVSMDGTADVFSIWLRTKNNCFPQRNTWQCCSARTVVAPCGIQSPKSLASPCLGGLRSPSPIAETRLLLPWLQCLMKSTRLFGFGIDPELLPMQSHEEGEGFRIMSLPRHVLNTCLFCCPVLSALPEHLPCLMGVGLCSFLTQTWGNWEAF